MLKSETIGDKELQKQRVRERYNERADPDKMFVIPATEQPINIYEDDQQRRVAVYVRVSTDSVQQTSSYELQKDTLVAVHDREFIAAHEFMAGLLIVEAIRPALASRVAGVIEINGLLAQRLADLLQGGGFLAAEEQHSIAVADDGLRGILVDGLQLTLRLPATSCQGLFSTSRRFLQILLTKAWK